MFKPLLAVAFLSTLAACGGDGSSDGPAPEVNANPAGIWRGTLTDMLAAEANPNNPDAAKFDLFVMADAKGNVRVISSDARGEFLGRGELRGIEGSEFNGYLDVYSYNPTSPETDPGARRLRLADFDGELVTRGDWTGDIEFDDLKLYSFSATFDEAESLKGASLQTLADIGTFSGPSLVDDAAPLTFTFQRDGSFEGADAFCLYSGVVVIPDSTYNLYRVALDIKELNGCPSDLRDTQYGGMGALINQDGVQTLRLLFKGGSKADIEPRILALDLRQ